METFKIVAFKLGEEEYGLDVEHVQSIERITHITRVPNAPEFVKGVINLRGHVTPVVDLQFQLGMGESKYTENTRVVIAKLEEMELGFIVDQTSDVIDIDPEWIEDINLDDMKADLFSGIAKIEERLIILLKLDQLLKLGD